jgi:hypothetical protein
MNIKKKKVKNIENIMGRPVVFTPAELKNKADEYFNMCKTTIINR